MPISLIIQSASVTKHCVAPNEQFQDHWQSYKAVFPSGLEKDFLLQASQTVLH